MKIKNTIGLALLLAFNTLLAQRNTQTIYGEIIDAESSEKLIGATISSVSTQKGTFTNSLGTFSLVLPNLEDSLDVSYVGYKRKRIYVAAQNQDKITVALESSLTLNTVVVKASRHNDDRMSITQLSLPMLRAIPMLGGERDIMRGLQLMPGIKAGSEGSVGLNVRGGSPDQNLILLDGIPIYNAAHLFGLSSVFNTAAIKTVEVVKGGFPARYGGRLASVIDISTKDGNMNEFQAEGNIGLISSHIQVEGPIVKQKASFLFSVRRSLYELYFLPKRLAEGGNSENPNYWMGDINAKLNYKVNAKNHFFATAYLSKDNFREREFQNSVRFTTDSRVGLNWSNAVFSAKWQRNWSPKLFSNMILYKNNYKFSIYSHYKKTDKGLNAPDTISIYNNDYDSDIRDVGLTWAFYYNLNDKHNLKFGTNVIRHQFLPGVSAIVDTSTTNVFNTPKPTGNSIAALESRFYVEDNWNINSVFQLNYGVHVSAFSVRGKQYSSLEPRISSKITFSDRFNIKLGYAQMQQYIHLLTNSGAGLPSDLWIPPTDKLRPQSSVQYGISFNYDLPKQAINISIEAYYKTMKGLIDYKEGSSFLIQGKDWESKIEQSGKGEAYGTELLIEKTMGKWKGWVGYTLAWSNRQFTGINQGKTYPYKYDRRHEISIVSTYALSKRWEWSAAWIFATGNAITLPTSQYTSSAFFNNQTSDPPTKANIINLNVDGGEIYRTPYEIFNYGSKNSSRIPNYHRLDVGLNCHKIKKRGEVTWSFSIYNIYARPNPYYIRYNYAARNTQNTNKGSFKAVSIFQLIPSIAYYRKF